MLEVFRERLEPTGVELLVLAKARERAGFRGVRFSSRGQRAVRRVQALTMRLDPGELRIAEVRGFVTRERQLRVFVRVLDQRPQLADLLAILVPPEALSNPLDVVRIDSSFLIHPLLLNDPPMVRPLWVACD